MNCYFIEQNYLLFLKKVCQNNQVNLLLSDSLVNSSVYSSWRYQDCNYNLIDDRTFDMKRFKKLKIFGKRDLNFFIEYRNEENLEKLLKFLYNSLNSKIINIFIFVVINSHTIEEFSSNIYKTFPDFRCNIINVRNSGQTSDIAYVRPIIRGCQSLDGILYSNQPQVKDVLTVDPLKCNLNGSVLTVVVNEV